MEVIQQRLEDNLKTLGVERGDTLLIHSSLRALGAFENRAAILFFSLLNVIGDDGTLLAPTLSYENVNKEHPLFNVNQTRSCVGGFTEFFRKQTGVIRSMHPTHSVCAKGKLAEVLTCQHASDHTPVGLHSPIHMLPRFGGKILFIGTGLKPNTSMHGVEELSRPPYLFGDKLDYTLIDVNGKETKKTYITHDFQGWEQRYDRVPSVLDAYDYSQGKILEADAYLINTPPLWEKANAKLIKNPFFFVDRKTDNSGLQ